MPLWTEFWAKARPRCNESPTKHPFLAHALDVAAVAMRWVGRDDQALLAVLPVRHAVLRQQGLKGKVLVVDEVHAFDPYMQRELVELLRFHAALGESAILLSATLTKAGRAMVVDAFRDGLGAGRASLVEGAYPLATLVAATTVAETACAVRDGLARRVAVTRLPDVCRAVTNRANGAAAWC
jgi:CRISPR-associated endonuclease/helicase Cas3